MGSKLSLAAYAIAASIICLACKEDVTINHEKHIYVNECSEDMILTGAFIIYNNDDKPQGDTINATSYSLAVGESASEVIGETGNKPPLFSTATLRYSFEFKDSIVLLGNRKMIILPWDTWYDESTNEQIGTIARRDVRGDTAITTYTFTDEYIRMLVEYCKGNGIYPIRKH